MKLHTITPAEGATKNRKRVGRGPGSGTGKTAGRGENGQNSRSGGGVRVGFEGGQTPLFRRLPKRGFSNARFKKVYVVINLDDLNRFDDGALVNPTILKEMGLVKKATDGIKVLGNGTLKKKLNVQANKFSVSAKKQIEDLGGKAEVI
ncbi:MAG: 50S ribosomal protein L15 [Bacilli bacterium]|nr:50S ribosomal protein L15 [Bacilli bacterium]